MAPFKDLQKEHPILDSTFRKFCSSHGIFSVPERFMCSGRFPYSGDCFREGITVILSIIVTMHQPWLNGMEMLEDAIQNKTFLATGIEEVDLFLRGGLRIGQLTELAGPSSSGKTQVCLHAASNCASKYKGTVVYIDTGNSFSPQRIAHFLGWSSKAANSQVKYQNLQEIMSNIVCHTVFDIFGLFELLQRLHFQLRSQMGCGECQTRLLVVDSISSLITPILGGSGSHGRALMIAAGSLLKKIANEHNLAVLVTNHTVAGEGGFVKPALGESWKSIPHVRLLLFLERGSHTCKISILNHPSMCSGQFARFTIPDSTINGEPVMKG